MQDMVPVAESAPLNILPAQANGVAFQQQRAEAIPSAIAQSKSAPASTIFARCFRTFCKFLCTTKSSGKELRASPTLRKTSTATPVSFWLEPAVRFLKPYQGESLKRPSPSDGIK